MVNPLLPLLELRHKHALKCRRLLRSPSHSKKRKKKRMRSKIIASQMQLSGSQVSIGHRSPSGVRSEQVSFILPTPLPQCKPGVQMFITGGGKIGVTLEIMTELLRYDFTPALILKLTESFQKSDYNHSWTLERDELVSFMGLLYTATDTPLPDYKFLSEEVDGVFRKHDRDLSDSLDLVEITLYLKHSDLARNMKKTYRPRFCDEQFLQQQEQERENIRVSRRHERKMRKDKLKYVKELQSQIDTMSVSEYTYRVLIESTFHSLLVQIAFYRQEESRSRYIKYQYISTLVKIFIRYSFENRRGFINDFNNKTEMIKTNIMEQSLGVIQKSMQSALRDGGSISKEAEALFKGVGFNCSLSKLVSDIGEAADQGRSDEIIQFLDTIDEGNFSSDKWQDTIHTFQGPREVEALAVRLISYYCDKYPSTLNVLTEVADNLGANLGSIVQLASTMYRRHHKKFPNNSPSALLIMCLYTCEGQHIDTLLKLPPGTAPAIYKDINWALREGPKASNELAQQMLRRWIGFIAVLSTTKVNSKTVWRGKKLYRGLMNLPEDIYSQFMEKEIGEWVYWPAATSASLSGDLVQSEFTKEGTSLVFVIDKCQEGAEMWHVSLYAEEQEMLLPPFTVFRVTDINKDQNTISLTVKGSLGDGKTAVTGFTDETDSDFADWIKRVQTDESHEAIATKVLSLITLQQELDKLPKVFLSNHSRLLIQEHKAVNTLIQTLQKVVSTVYRPPPSVQQHLNSMWKHVNSATYLTKITKADFGVDFSELFDRVMNMKANEENSQQEDENWD